MTEAEVLRARLGVTGVQQVKKGVQEVRQELRGAASENRTLGRSSTLAAGGIKSLTDNNRRFRSSLDDARRQSKGFRYELDQTSASAKRLGQTVDQTGQKVSRMADRKGFGGIVKGALATAAAYGVVNRTVAGGMAAIKAYERQQGNLRALTFNLGSPGIAQMKDAQTRAFANAYGQDIQSARQGVVKLAAANVRPGDLVGTLKGFAALGASGGANSEQIARAFEQYTQVAGQGKLQGDELRIIQENGVMLRKLLMDAGFGSRIGSRDNPLTFEEINQVVIAFGKSTKAQQLLEAAANTVSGQITVLANTVQTELLPPIGEGLTPAVKDAAVWLRNLIRGADPEAIKNYTEAVARSAPAVLGAGALILIGFKGWQLRNAIYAARFFKASTSAAGGLNNVAVAANRAATALTVNQLGGAAGAGGLGPGFYMQPGAAQATQTAAAARRGSYFANRLKRGAGAIGTGVGLAAGTIGGGMAGEAIVGHFTDNEMAKLAGSIAGSIIGGAAVSKLASMGAAAIAGKAAAAGAAAGAGAAGASGAAGAAGAVGAAGGIGLAGTVGLVGTGVAALMGAALYPAIWLSEHVTGQAGTSRSFGSRVGKGAENIWLGQRGREQAYQADSMSSAYMTLKAEVDRRRKMFEKTSGWFPSLQEYARIARNSSFDGKGDRQAELLLELIAAVREKRDPTTILRRADVAVGWSEKMKEAMR